MYAPILAHHVIPMKIGNHLLFVIKMGTDFRRCDSVAGNTRKAQRRIVSVTPAKAGVQTSLLRLSLSRILILVLDSCLRRNDDIGDFGFCHTRKM